MICPRCKHDFDSKVDSDSADIKCPQCSGRWISGEYINWIIAEADDTTDIEAALETILDLEFSPSKRKCPSCIDRNLKAIQINYTELDFCAACKGLFFDKGELKQVFPSLHAKLEGSRVEPKIEAKSGFWASLLGFGGDRN